MKTNRQKMLLTVILSLGCGILATSLIVNSDNGYVAGFIVLPIMFFIGLIVLVLIVAGVVEMALGRDTGPRLLLGAVLVPLSFVGSALLAKQLELGAYKEQPMIPFVQAKANVVLFKEGTTHNEIADFWDKVLSEPHESGRGTWPLPGIQGMTGAESREGHEAMAFSFREDATDEQKLFVVERVRSSPIVFALLENAMVNSSPTPTNHNANTPNKKVFTVNSGEPHRQDSLFL